MCKEYEGWSNYPTWCVNLWLSNNEPLYRAVLEKIEEVKSSEDPEAVLADWIKDMVENGNPLTRANLYSDLMTWAIGMADYYEIAKALLED